MLNKKCVGCRFEEIVLRSTLIEMIRFEYFQMRAFHPAPASIRFAFHRRRLGSAGGKKNAGPNTRQTRPQEQPISYNSTYVIRNKIRKT